MASPRKLAVSIAPSQPAKKLSIRQVLGNRGEKKNLGRQLCQDVGGRRCHSSVLSVQHDSAQAGTYGIYHQMALEHLSHSLISLQLAGSLSLNVALDLRNTLVLLFSCGSDPTCPT